MNLANLLTSTHLLNLLSSLSSEKAEICIQRDYSLNQLDTDLNCIMADYHTEEVAALSSRLDVIMMEIRDISESLALNYNDDGSLI
tara:strand:+ start:244 stop:501 length:258 start_codon:yes stop_codon:yes gene_type:complete